MANVPRNGRFLYSAITRFPPEETMQYFESLGLPLKTERGNRVFPVSDRSADVIDTLTRELKRAGVSFLHGRAGHILEKKGAVAAVEADGKLYPCRAAVLATGGLSYPATGSTGDGHQMAQMLGHTLIPAVPSLVPLTAADEDCARLMGLSLKNVTLHVIDVRGKTVYTELGELLFTHFGLSGPVVLSASAHLRDFAKNRYTAEIDLKPGLSEEMLNKRLLRDFSEYSNRQFGNALDKLLPSKLIPVVIERAGIPPETKVHSVTKAQREALLHTLKALSFSLTGTRPIEEAVVTSGGVKTAEIHPGTMQSRLVKGLYFAGN
jgi:predicted Rossmann fold flavoprotein